MTDKTKVLTNYLRQLGAKGGKASAKNLTPEQRREKARAQVPAHT